MNTLQPQLAAALICGILAIGLAMRQSPSRSLEYRPDPIALRQPLASLPERIGSFRRVDEITLHESIVRKLGADDQITWIYLDESQPQDAPGSAIRVHVAYYTGYLQTLRVRHVPEICYLNFGYDAVDNHRGSVALPDQAAPVPVKIFRFAPEENANRIYGTAYCFIANGQYCAASDEVRLICSEPIFPTSYFLKLEILPGRLRRSANDSRFFEPAPIDANATLECCQRFFPQFLPALKACLPNQ